MRKTIASEDERYHNIIENSMNGIVIHRLIQNPDDKNKTHLILEVNKAFQTLTGLCSEEVVGKSVSDVFVDKVILEKIKQIITTKKPIRFDGYFTQFNKHLEILTFPTGNDEYVSVLTNITHRKYSERKKQEIEKELTSRLEQQSALSEISQLTLSSLSLKEIMQATMEIVAKALSVDYSKVLRFIPADHELEMEAGVGWDVSNTVPYRVPADLDSQAGFTLMSEKPVVVEDLSLETRFSGPQLLIDHHVTSGVSVIIGQLEDPYGVMGVHTITHRFFSHKDVEFLQSVANVLASTINQHHISQELEESEMRYRLLAENASDMISTHNLDTQYTYASPYSFELIGYLPEELEGKLAGRFIHPDDLENVVKTQENILDTKKVNTLNYRLKHKNGNYVWVESTARILNPQNGEMIVITRDISERIRAEQKLKRSEAKYRTIFENTGTVIAIIEPDGMVTVLNQKFKEVFGISTEEVVGKKRWYDFIYKDDVKVMEEFQRRRIAGDKDLPDSYDFRFWDVNGNLKHAFINVDLIPGTDNILASISDVTSLKETESKLKEELSINKSLACIYTPLVTPDSGMGQIGEAVLREAKKLTNSKYGYVSSTDWETTQSDHGSISTTVDCQNNLVAPHWRKEHVESYPGLWGHCLNTREAFFTNSPQSHPSSQGTPRDHITLKNFLSVPVLLGDELVGQIALANTENQYQEEDVKAITRLAEFYALAIQKKRSDDKIRNSLKDKEILLQEIHHRVKNNMQIISSLLNLQSSFIKDPEAIDVFRESQNRVKSMALLHENLYQSRDMDRVDFKQYVKKLTDNLLITYSASAGHIHREIRVEDVKLNIETAIPCGLIINELLTNSLKYAFPNGEKGTLFLKIYAKDDKYVLLLGDDGVGLPENFDPESTQTLGLRLVHNLVNQIDGHLKIIPGEGTCFEIMFQELQYKKRI